MNLRTNPEVRKMPISWTEGKSLHIPLTFLGAIGEEALLHAIDSGQMAASLFQPFWVKVSGISYFYRSKTGHGSTIFIDISDPEKILKNIHKNLTSYLSEAEFSPATRFNPYIVVGELERSKKEHEQKEYLYELSQIEVSGIEPILIDKIDVVEMTNQDFINPKFAVVRSFQLGSN